MRKFNCIILSLFIVTLTKCAAQQTLAFKTILDATKTSNTPSKFTKFIEPYGFCFVEEKEMPTFTYYTHFKCGTSDIGTEGIRVNFSVSNDGSLNSSFLTRNEGMVSGFKKELEEFKFIETQENVDLSRQNAKWYTSDNYPEILVLWEYNLDENNRKVWHIGFVWNTPQN
ncbi:hypothetical protein [Roseivirga echinicomitans]|uniref:Uncharacterized protein n=1 Tax=Roseivirga echinicomitans TaxID=296218 RepID=A0A150X2F3_9BACT|nr:hypothetical protein [Roseivirga echinicomitans]KYG72901.1 hypothetical protein AWN68_09380 [Roseivirga echinicomitans]